MAVRAVRWEASGSVVRATTPGRAKASGTFPVTLFDRLPGERPVRPPQPPRHQAAAPDASAAPTASGPAPPAVAGASHPRTLRLQP